MEVECLNEKECIIQCYHLIVVSVNGVQMHEYFPVLNILGNWTYLGQLNYCADGSAPPEHVTDMTINPCSIDDPFGTNFTVPAQQFNVATLPISANETLHMYYGERFRSSKDGLKAHDFQAWIPIRFIDACVQPMLFLENFTLNIDVEFET